MSNVLSATFGAFWVRWRNCVDVIIYTAASRSVSRFYLNNLLNQPLGFVLESGISCVFNDNAKLLLTMTLTLAPFSPKAVFRASMMVGCCRRRSAYSTKRCAAV